MIHLANIRLMLRQLAELDTLSYFFKQPLM